MIAPPVRSDVAALAVCVTALAVYVPTLAPTITWSNGGADSGDFAAAVASLGVPHPPGYPSYVLLGYLWTRLPLGADLAYRLNLMSATAAALAAGLCAASVMVVGRRLGLGGLAIAGGGAFGGLTFALAPLTWSQATIAEVYAPGMLLLALVTLLAQTWQGHPTRLALVATGLAGGVGFGMLPQIVFAAPGVAIAGLAGARPRMAMERLGLLALGACLGLSIFLYLPLRAVAEPFVNWGDPSTPERIWAVMSADMYHGLFGAYGLSDWLGRVFDSAALVGRDAGPAGVVLAVVGSWVLWHRARVTFWQVWSLVVLTVAFRAGYYAEGNVVYLIPVLYGVGILAGVGAASVADGLGRRYWKAAPAMMVVLITIVGWQASATRPTVDASADYAADRFSRAALAALPPDAILVSERDETTFGLWYRQALGERPDVAIVDARLLPHSWYRTQLVRRYPDLDAAAVRPGGLTALARPVYVVPEDSVEEVIRPATRFVRDR